MSSLPPLQVTTSNDNKNADEKLVTSVIDKSQVDNTLNEISKSAVETIRNFIGTNNDMFDVTTKRIINDASYNETESIGIKHSFDSKETDKVKSEIDKIRDIRKKGSTLPGAYTKYPSHDASITLYDVNYNDNKIITNMIERTNLKIDPNNTSKFIIL